MPAKAKTVKEKKIQKMSPAEFAAKCEWEGGVHEGFLYGLKSEHLDDSNEKFNKAVKKAEDLHSKYQLSLKVLDGMIDEIEA